MMDRTADQFLTAPAPSFGADSLALHMPTTDSLVSSLLQDSPLTTPDFTNFILRSVAAGDPHRHHGSMAADPQTADIVKAVMEIQEETDAGSNLLMPPPISTSMDHLHHHQNQHQHHQNQNQQQHQQQNQQQQKVTHHQPTAVRPMVAGKIFFGFMVLA